MQEGREASARSASEVVAHEPEEVGAESAEGEGEEERGGRGVLDLVPLGRLIGFTSARALAAS